MRPSERFNNLLARNPKYRDQVALMTLHGGAIEYQEAQAKLFAKGRRWCPACATVQPTKNFSPNSRMTLGLASRCRICVKKRIRRMSFVKLSGQTRLARFFKRNPGKRPTPTRGPYEKTLEARAAGEHLIDPVNDDLWLAAP